MTILRRDVMHKSIMNRFSILMVSVVLLCGSAYTGKTNALAPQKCGTSCSVDGVGYCKITCPAGSRANCSPGRIYWQGSKQIIEVAKCYCSGGGSPPAKKDEPQCGGSVEMHYYGRKCSQTCAPGVEAVCDLWNGTCSCRQ